MHDCFMNIKVPVDFSLKSLKFTCQKNCTITQEGLLSIQNDLTLDGDLSWFNVNFENLKAKSFSFKAEAGHFQMNHFTVSSSSQVELALGDIILQSMSSYRLKWSNQLNLFCFSAPNIQILNSLTNCATTSL